MGVTAFFGCIGGIISGVQLLSVIGRELIALTVSSCPRKLLSGFFQSLGKVN